MRRGSDGGRRRSGTPADLVVVGLGNPGSRYVGTRHNVGVEVLETLCERHGGRLRKGKELALVDEIRIGDKRVALAFPQTYMNESGQSVVSLVRRYGIQDDPGRLLVVHDELDLPVGRLKVKLGGGLAGHNGLRSITSHLHTQDYGRIRLGVGKPSGRKEGVDHVLSKPGARDRAELDIVVAEAADAVETIAREGYEVAMGRYNAG